MLASTHRLRRRVDFAATIRGGRRAARGALVVHYGLATAAPPVPDDAEPADLPESSPAPAEALPPPRAGFVVSKAVGGAVIRNLVKRRLRHLMRARIGALPAGAMLVVRALPAAAGRTYTELGADLDGALARATSGRRR
ncbi:ribonuclease P protein component [Virgisporangium aurantiacum]|uniref:Ribonuclease P protein component n=1 Tax=Virgisporangium aurantiacum TaxID=175570 RepID=A0A8J3ZE89_9ACTN|nr:ribonuclease P protein component [Virgisporangium aurantiacum]GIJ59663.1 ribonuclease P protein component [Virgisporangium aurantiacum]